MKSYRIVHQVLFVLAFLPLVLGWGPWYLMVLLPLALVVPYGINELILARKPQVSGDSRRTGALEHAYRGKG